MDRSGGSVFRIKLDAAKVESNRAAASTLTLELQRHVRDPLVARNHNEEHKYD